MTERTGPRKYSTRHTGQIPPVERVEPRKLNIITTAQVGNDLRPQVTGKADLSKMLTTHDIEDCIEVKLKADPAVPITLVAQGIKQVSKVAKVGKVKQAK